MDFPIYCGTNSHMIWAALVVCVECCCGFGEIWLVSKDIMKRWFDFCRAIYLHGKVSR